MPRTHLMPEARKMALPPGGPLDPVLLRAPGRLTPVRPEDMRLHWIPPTCTRCDKPAVARLDLQARCGPLSWRGEGPTAVACADHVEEVRDLVREQLEVVDRPLEPPERRAAGEVRFRIHYDPAAGHVWDPAAQAETERRKAAR